MAKNSEISIIICTHNRAELLRWSLQGYAQLKPALSFELLVVLNACTDHSLAILQELQEQIPQLRWTEEHTLGLSAARNRGADVAQAPWLVYIDDDARPRPDLLVHIREVLRTGHYRAFSGHTHFVRYDSPAWIQGKDIEAPVHAPHLSDLPQGAFMNGCICGFERQTLLDVGGFDPNYGMKGRHTAYGEEVDVQFRLWQALIPIAYHPGIVVDHRSHFNSLSGLLKAAFLKGRYMQYLLPQQRWRHLTKAFGFCIWGLFIWFPLAIDRGWKRAALDCFGAACYHLGRALSFNNRLPQQKRLR